ncbi:putative ABC transporter permease [Ruminococcus gauvreauii]|uniref:putative ABC transporter permease n=1 Tax=Ruminococcus gauvreauii TaxID=438033 RepID=UPI0039840D44
MYQYSMVQWLLCFYIYCFIGWCWESAYVSAKKQQWINRGFMHGPFLPIYGSGAVMMLVVSAPYQDNLVLTFVSGMIGATLLELVTGILMEALFKVRYWDYSSKKFNYRGYICLGSSLAWGVFTILMTRFVHKPIDTFLNWLPPFAALIAVLALSSYIATDFTISFIGALNLRSLLDKIDRAKEDLAVMQRRLDALVAFADVKPEGKSGDEQSAPMQKLDELKSAVNDAMEKLRSLKNPPRRKHRGRILGNPTMVSSRYQSALEDLKQLIKESKKK